MSEVPGNCRKTALIALGALAAFFVAGMLFRPLMPIDETRYMTVAWEMWLSKDYALLSLNFAPYHHKPPMLFWLINLSWSLFGVSRWAAMVPVFIAASCFIWLTRRITSVLLPGDDAALERATWITLGSAPFLIYSSLVMFDILLTCFVLGVLLCFLAYARGGKWWLPAVAGLLLGCAVLTKGPVAYLHVLWPLLLYPFWRPQSDSAPSKAKWYAQVLLSVVISAGPVLAWLYPTMQEADENFIKWLIWRQTAGRVTGDFKSSHARPFSFYLMFLPAVMVPWAFSRTFWSGIRDLRAEFSHRREFRFLLCWLLPVFLSFCAVSGKQPHYMVPLLPGVYVLLVWMFAPVAVARLRNAALVVVGLLVAGHAAAAATGWLKAYDLTPVAELVAQHPDRDWAYVRKYQGELGFLGRLEFPLESLEVKDINDWFDAHPDGLMVTRRVHNMHKLDRYAPLHVMDYRSRKIGIYHMPGHNVDDIEPEQTAP